MPLYAHEAPLLAFLPAAAPRKQQGAKLAACAHAQPRCRQWHESDPEAPCVRVPCFLAMTRFPGEESVDRIQGPQEAQPRQ